MEYNDTIICGVCATKCSVEDARIEWLKDINDKHEPTDIYLCHKECAAGYKSARVMVGDIDLDSDSYTKEELFERLNEMKTQYTWLSRKIDGIQSTLFSTR